nr:Gag-Pol polyprotein [Tanacetum cinerariifolium]
MLDRIDFASWKQRIRLYCQGKENGVNILKSIDKGPYKIRIVRETLAKSTEGAPQFGPEQSRVYFDLTSEEKDRYNADIRATNILLQGLPKDIYTFINHNTDANDIWDNVKMLLEGSELTKEDRESQLYDDFEHFRQHKGESIHDYYVRLKFKFKRDNTLIVIQPPCYSASKVSDDELEAPEEASKFPEQAPPFTDYVPGPEHPPSPDYVPGLEHPLLPDYVPGPEYPKYLVPSDNEGPIEDQSLPADALPTTLSSGYVADYDPLKEDPDEDPEEDPVEYPADKGDDNDADDDDEEEEEEEKEHLDLADSTTLPTVDHVPSTEDTKAFETDKSATIPPSPRLYRTRISIPLQPLHLPSPPLPLHAPSLPLLLPTTDRKEDIPDADPGLDVAPATDYNFVDTVDATPRRPMSREVGYRIMDVWDDMVGDMEGRAPTTLEDLSQRVTDLAATLARDTHEMYVRFKDAQDDRALQRAESTRCLKIGHCMSRSVCYRDSGLRTREPEPARDRKPQDGPADDGSSCCRDFVLSFSYLKMTSKRTTTTTPMTDAAIKALIAQGVANALAEYKAHRSSGNGDDSHEFGSGRMTERVSRECTYSEFLKCQPLNFK